MRPQRLLGLAIAGRHTWPAGQHKAACIGLEVTRVWGIQSESQTSASIQAFRHEHSRTIDGTYMTWCTELAPHAHAGVLACICMCTGSHHAAGGHHVPHVHTSISQRHGGCSDGCSQLSSCCLHHKHHDLNHRLRSMSQQRTWATCMFSGSDKRLRGKSGSRLGSICTHPWELLKHHGWLQRQRDFGR